MTKNVISAIAGDDEHIKLHLATDDAFPDYRTVRGAAAITTAKGVSAAQDALQIALAGKIIGTVGHYADGKEHDGHTKLDEQDGRLITLSKSDLIGILEDERIKPYVSRIFESGSLETLGR